MGVPPVLERNPITVGVREVPRWPGRFGPRLSLWQVYKLGFEDGPAAPYIATPAACLSRLSLPPTQSEIVPLVPRLSDADLRGRAEDGHGGDPGVAGK